MQSICCYLISAIYSDHNRTHSCSFLHLIQAWVLHWSLVGQSPWINLLSHQIWVRLTVTYTILEIKGFSNKILFLEISFGLVGNWLGSEVTPWLRVPNPGIARRRQGRPRSGRSMRWPSASYTGLASYYRGSLHSLWLSRLKYNHFQSNTSQ